MIHIRWITIHKSQPTFLTSFYWSHFIHNPNYESIGILHEHDHSMYICIVAVQYLKIEHDLNSITTTSTCFKRFFHFLLREPKPVSYKGLYIDLATP